MDWYQLVFELIDMRSFSNLWYWIALAVVWSSTSHWVLGVPFDTLQRARRVGGQSEIDFEDLVRINCNRILYIADVSGLWLLGVGCFLLTGLGVLGFVYWVEFAQAIFLIALPMSLVSGMSVKSARHIQTQSLTGEALCKRMARHRFQTQAIGMVSIFVTAMWGMFQNMAGITFGG